MASGSHIADIVEQNRITELIRKCKDVESLERLKLKHPEKYFVDRICNKIKLLSIIGRKKEKTNEVEVEIKKEDLMLCDEVEVETNESKSNRLDLSPETKKKLDESLKELKKRGRKARR